MEMEMATMYMTARRRGREHGGMMKEATAETEEERLASRDETWSFVIVLSLEGRRCDRFIYTDHRRHRRQKLKLILRLYLGFFFFFFTILPREITGWMDINK